MGLKKTAIAVLILMGCSSAAAGTYVTGDLTPTGKKTFPNITNDSIGFPATNEWLNDVKKQSTSSTATKPGNSEGRNINSVIFEILLSKSVSTDKLNYLSDCKEHLFE